MHKTGSSAIQDTLATAVPPETHSYLQFGNPNGSLAVSQAFSSAFKERIRRDGRVVDEAEVERVRRNGLLSMDRALSSWNSEKGIVSAEDISNLPRGDLERLRSHLLQYCETISALLYVRMPRSYLESAFQQILKVYTPRFHETPLRLHYRSRFAPYDEIFGQENVTIRWFARDRLRENCIVQDFAHAIGLDLDPCSVVSSNESLSMEAVKLLYVYRSIFPRRDNVLDKQILNYLYDFGSEKFAFHPELASTLMDLDQDQLSWLEDRIGIERPHEDENPLPNAICSLDELMQPSPRTLETLAQQAGTAASAVRTPAEIAQTLRKVALEPVNDPAR